MNKDQWLKFHFSLANKVKTGQATDREIDIFLAQKVYTDLRQLYSINKTEYYKIKRDMLADGFSQGSIFYDIESKPRIPAHKIPVPKWVVC